MGQIILVFYIILTAISFASYRIMRKKANWILLLIISLIFLGIEFYGLLKSDILNLGTTTKYQIFSWLFFLIIGFRALRKSYLRQRGYEPIITWGHPYDITENRKATSYDTMFTLLLLGLSSVLTLLLGFILT